jgi:hypothetical protein
MPFHFKALILVMAVTLTTFWLAKPLFVKFMAEDDFARRRNIWLSVTLAAFLIPNIWLFMVVAAVIIGYGASKDSNPAALYLLLLLVIPPLREQLPTGGLVKQIMALDHLRLLSLVLLLPTTIKLRNASREQAYASGTNTRLGLQAPDFLIVAYAAVQVVLMFPYESVTASARRSFLLGIDILLPYFVLSRVCRSREAIVDAMASFVLALVVLSPLAVLEFLRGWILYAGIEERWGTSYMMAYLTRGETLRAQVTGGHAIVFGYAMAVALSMWFYLQTLVLSRAWRWAALLTLIAGLASTLARGPWVGAMVMLVIFVGSGPNAGRRVLNTAGFFALLAVVVMATPYAGKLVEHLPFIGTVNEETVSYRQRLAEMSWMLIKQNPLFGSPYFMMYMEELRQGEGIIDLVNAYAGIALSFGLTGFGLFAGFFALILVRCRAASRRMSEADPDFSLLGSCLLACIGGVLVMIATVSNYLSITYIYWSLAALAVAYVRLDETGQPLGASPMSVDTRLPSGLAS